MFNRVVAFRCCFIYRRQIRSCAERFVRHSFFAVEFTGSKLVKMKTVTICYMFEYFMFQATEVRVASTGVMQKRVESLASPPADVVMKHTLKWTVKSAIYRIVVKFQRHIMYVSSVLLTMTDLVTRLNRSTADAKWFCRNVPLSSEHKQMLEQYLEFRVG